MTKIVSLSQEAYDALSRLKEQGDSFSDVVLSLAERERLRRLDALMGSWRMSPQESEAFLRQIYERRRLSKPRRIND